MSETLSDYLLDYLPEAAFAFVVVVGCLFWGFMILSSRARSRSDDQQRTRKVAAEWPDFVAYVDHGDKL